MAVMHFHYTQHIKTRIRQREVRHEQIESTVTRPDRTQPGFGGRQLAQKRFYGKLLEVVYKKEEDRIILITAYWLRERL